MRGRRRALFVSEAGYTLVEMLVALTLLGFIAVFISGTLRFGARAWEASARGIDRVEQVEAVQAFLRRELSQVTPLYFEPAAAEPEAVFSGEAAELRFAAPLAIHFGDGGLYVLVLRQREAESRSDLEVRWELFRPDALTAGAPPREPVTLLRNISGLRFQYFGRARAEAEPDWSAEWREMDAMPDLVRVDIDFPASDSRIWPSLVVALKTADGVER